MTDDTAASYDTVVYPGNAIPQTHPDRLATIATLFGMQPPPVSRCRVLELGCGIGGNLVAMAYQHPKSVFVGIDLSRRSIEIGNRNVEEIELKNIALRHFDIMGVTEEFGEFDYIIAHGVYSWVPPAVRERMLQVYKAHLAPQGVGYISYNAYPGSHLRDIARDIMLYHSRNIDDPREKLEQSHAMLKYAAETIPEGDLYGRIVRDQLKRVETTAQEVIYHDDLEPAATPFMLHEVAEAAARHGLQYLCDANFGRSQLFDLPEAVVKLIEQIPQEEAVGREQYIDFVTGRTFRRTLVVHDGVALNRSITPESVMRYHVAASLAPAGDGNPLDTGAATFKGARGRTLATEDPLGKAALLHLGAVWPQSIAFPDLLESAAGRLREAGAVPEGEASAQVEALTNLLFRAYAAGTIELHTLPPPLTTEIGERPEASLIARKLIESGPVITNLRHARVVLHDAIARRFLMLVDGTRTLDQLVADLNAALAAGAMETSADTAPQAPVQVTREQVEDNLRILARLALLVR